jgi:cell division protein FtsB
MVRVPSRRLARDRRRRARRFAFAVAGLLVVALYVGPVRSYLGARDRAAAARADLQRLEQQHAALERRLRALSSDAATVALAREDGYIFPGETPFRIAGTSSP